MTVVLSGCNGHTEVSSGSEQFSGTSSKTEESNINSEMTAETPSEEDDESVSSEKGSRIETNISSETADEDIFSEENSEINISKDTETTSIYREATDVVSETTEYSGYHYRVSEVAGTWYLNGDLTSDRMTIDYEGNFANVSKDETVTSGQVRIESNQEQNGSTSYGYTFYKNDGSLWYIFSATGDIPVYHLYERMTDNPHYQSETDIVNTDGNLLRYCNSLEGIYYSDASGYGEHYSVDHMGGFELLSDNGEILESGHIAFTSVVNPDGTTSFCGNFVSIEGETLLIFPIKDIANISNESEESGYYRMN